MGKDYSMANKSDKVSLLSQRGLENITVTRIMNTLAVCTTLGEKNQLNTERIAYADAMRMAAPIINVSNFRSNYAR
jgi:hypothetical protein